MVIIFTTITIIFNRYTPLNLHLYWTTSVITIIGFTTTIMIMIIIGYYYYLMTIIMVTAKIINFPIKFIKVVIIIKMTRIKTTVNY